jgi:Lon protease-like protein
LIVLKGLLRFRIREEIEGRGGYRRVRPSYDEFKTDLEPMVPLKLDRKIFLERLQPYLEAHAMPIHSDVLKGLSDAALVTSLCAICPFDPREKQALLESPTLAARADALLTLLQIGVFEAGNEAPRQ